MRNRKSSSAEPFLAAALIGVAAFLAGCAAAATRTGATVNVYVAAPLCAGAKGELASHGSSAGHFTVAVRCLAPSETSGGGVDLATDGSNSRRATADSSAVATLEPPGPGREVHPRDPRIGRNPPRHLGLGRGGACGGSSSAIEGAGDSGVRSAVGAALEPS